MADGEIRINSKLDNKEFITDSKQLLSAINSLKSTAVSTGKSMQNSAAGYGAAMRNNIWASREFNSELKRLEGEAAKLKSTLEKQRNSAFPTEEYTKMSSEISKAEKKYDSLIEKEKVLNAGGANQPSEKWRQLQVEIERAKENLNDYYAINEQLRKKKKTLSEQYESAISMGAKTKAASIFGQLARTKSEYSNNRTQIEQTSKSLEMLELQQEKLRASGDNLPSAQWRKLQTEIELASEKITELVNKRNELAYDDKAFISGKDTAEYAEMERQYNTIVDKIHDMRVESENAGNGFHIIARSAGSAVVQLAKMAGHGVLSFLRKLASGAKNAAIQLAKLAKSAVVSGLKKIGSAAGGAIKGLLGLNRHTRSASNGMKHGLTTIMKYGLGIRSLYFLFRKLRSAITESFEELSKHDPVVKKSLNGLKTALNGLKGSLAMAFAPILTAAAPALTRLINLLTTAMNTVGAFFAALSGRTTFQQSIGTLGQVSQKSLDAVSSSAKVASKDVGGLKEKFDKFHGIEDVGRQAKKTAKKTKDLERQLAGFDQLNILKKNNSGGGGGGAAAGFAYQTAQIQTSVLDFATRLREMWANGEWDSIGVMIAGKINDAFVKVKDLITWENVEETVTGAIDAIVGIFNGLVSPNGGIDFRLIGQTIGEGANTIIQSMKRILSEVEWETLGTKIGDFFAGIVDTVKPGDLAELLAGKFLAAIRFIRGFLSTIFKIRLGKYLAEAVNGIFASETLFSEAAGLFNTAILGALKIGQDFVNKFDSDTAATNIKNGLRKIKWGEIANTAWTLFKTAVAKLGNFITLLFGEDEPAPIIKPTIDKHGLEKQLLAEDKAAGGSGIKVDISPEGIGKTLSTALEKVLLSIGNFLNNLPWEQWGTDLGKFLSSIDWIELGNELAQALKNLFDGLDDLVSAAIYGEDYKENAIWKSFHPRKAAEYEVEKLTGGSSHAMQLLESHGLDAQGFADLKAVVDAARNKDLRGAGGYTKDELEASTLLQQILDEIEIANKEEPETSVDEELWKRFIESGSDPASEFHDKGNEAWFDGLGKTSAQVFDEAGKVIEAAKAEREALDALSGEDVGQTIGEEAAEAWKQYFSDAWDNQPGQTDSYINDPRTPLARSLDDAFADLGRMLGISAEAEEYDMLADAERRAAEESKKQTKVEKKQTKAINALGNGIDLNVDGTPLDKMTDGQATATVTVGFVPAGANDEEDKPSGLLEWLQNIFAPGVNVQAAVGLINDGFTTVFSWITKSYMGGKIEKGVSVVRDGFKSVRDKIVNTVSWWGGAVKKPVDIKKEFTSVKDKIVSNVKWWGGNVNKPVGIIKTFTSVKDQIVSNVKWWGGKVEKPVDISKKFKSVRDKIVDNVKWWGKDDIKKPVGISKTFNNVKDQIVNTVKWWGGDVNKPVGLSKSGWSTVGSWVAGALGTAVSIAVSLVSGKIPDWLKWLFHAVGIPGFERGGIVYPNGTTREFARGGVLRGSVASMFGGINRYAAGTSKAHGTMFLAGEAGPEVVGHVGGRTEVLNKSQMAQAIYSAVVSGMTKAVNALGNYIAAHMTACTNAIITTIGMNSGVAAMRGLNYYAPAMATGTVMPYDVAAQIARSTQELQTTMDENNDELIQAMVNAISSAAANIVSAVRYGQRSGGNYTTQNAIDDINRRALMFNRSPINV